MSRWTRTAAPSETAIPADCWPRCWSANRPKYVRLATSMPCLAQMPKTPHISAHHRFPRHSKLGEGNLELTFELDGVTARQAEERQLDVVPPCKRLNLRHRARRHAHDVSARRLAEERGVQAQRQLGPDRGASHSDPAQQAALS